MSPPSSRPRWGNWCCPLPGRHERGQGDTVTARVRTCRRLLPRATAKPAEGSVSSRRSAASTSLSWRGSHLKATTDRAALYDLAAAYAAAGNFLRAALARASALLRWY